MTNQSPAGLSEFTWYSRLSAWIGAAMLLVQSVLGRDAGPVTVLAVLLLGLGFICFLLGLAIDSRVQGTGLLLGTSSIDHVVPAEEVEGTPAHASGLGRVDPETKDPEPRTHVTLPEVRKEDPLPTLETNTASAGPIRRPKFRERAKKTATQPEPATARVLTQGEKKKADEMSFEPATDTTAVGLETEMLAPSSVSIGSECPRCENSLRVGQLSATCPVCNRTHHAICWMENYFHCAVADCNGHGNLEAPTVLPGVGDVPGG